MSLYSELKRRNVFRVALLYLVSSWLLLQVADVGISLLGLPEWTGRFVFLLLVLGFPLVMVFSWVYEITPDGIKKEKDVPSDASIAADTARKLNTAVVVLLVLALGGLAIDRLIPEQAVAPDDSAEVTAVSSEFPDHSIAVLPFVNMSADSENEYFSDGLSEELLNLLARIPELQVAARTSAFSFKNSTADIPEIAEKLHVANVLEGSVRKSGNSIRVTAQLIKASNGYHLWSETWDRELTDVFAIQDEIAAAVVDELRVTLLGDAPHARVTDTRAFELFLQSKPAANLATEEGLEEAAALLTEALAIDPEFSDAWAQLATVQINQVGRGFVPGDIGVDRSRASNNRALEIDPNNFRALSGLIWIAVHYDWDFDLAAQLNEQATALAPNNVNVLNSAASLAAAFGKHAQQIELLEAARERDPLAMSVLHNLTIAYSNNGRLEESFQTLKQMRATAPGSFFIRHDEAWLTWFQGDAAAAHEIFLEVGGVNGTWGSIFTLHDLGRVDDVQQALQTLRNSGGRPTQLATAYAYIGELDNAFAEFDRAYETRDGWLIEIRGFNFLEPLYDDPRWDALLKKVGVSDADAERISFQ